MSWQGSFGVDWSNCQAAVWRNLSRRLKPIASPACPRLASLYGMEQQKTQLVDNTRALVTGQGGHHALLWGARGCGKSSLIRAMLPLFADQGLRMVQLDNSGLAVLEELVDELGQLPFTFILLCDDLSFDGNQANLPRLKVLLEGALEPMPDNLRMYASSNRRHLLPEYQCDNSQAQVGEAGELHFSDSVEATLALADRFGLWLSFYSGDQQDYLRCLELLLHQAGEDAGAHQQAALRFARRRGVYSYRTARHFVDSLDVSRKLGGTAS